MTPELPFKISSALKNIIGKELITDEFVAVFELVKNSFDAYAENVQVIFKDLHDNSKAKIIIKDNGKGMNIADIKDKWLFVAYSAKKTGIEDKDYRNKIKVSRVFAGAKGVGRFSCDRLGNKLNLISVKDEKGAKIENLSVNWDDFEIDPLKEFINVKVKHKELTKDEYKIKHGTVLEITGLRDTWTRDRILRLKKSLAKLINPSQDNDSKNFQIEILAENETEEDTKEKFDRDKVNGYIKNEVFESLKIKTTSISVEISKDGKQIYTVLQDRGDTIYKLTEKNPVYGNLYDIKFHLFQLNFKAKLEFNKIMGMESIKYGSVFMYKNGFRVYPFGEPGEDLLMIDRRKTQGYNRFLGNRDLIGRIEINGDQTELKETTSRDGGLVKTDTYNQLVKFFEEYVLKRLENYVVNVIKWGDERINEETGELIHPELWAKDVKIQILEVITGFIKSENVIKIEYDEDFLNILESKQDKSVDKIIKNISKIAANSNNPAIVKEAAKIGKVVKEVKADAEKDKQRADQAEAKAEKVESELEEEIRQSLFQKSIIGREKQDLLSLQHQIRHTASTISWGLDKLVEAVHKDAPKEKLIEYINGISLEVRKISSASQFVTKANFNMDATKIKGDIVAFIDDYAENVFKAIDHYIHEKNHVQITVENKIKAKFETKFRPLELTVIIDNLFSNAKKAGAKKISLTWSNNKNNTVLSFKDDGQGIPDKNVDRIFDFSFSTTDGSGIGLYHVKQIVESMKGEVSVNNKLPKGTEFLISFKK